MEALIITYLGVAGWHFKTESGSLLLDPYFTRIPLWQVFVGRPQPNDKLIEDHTPGADWVLVTHPHFDHLMDIPTVLRLTRAHCFCSPQSASILQLYGIPPDQITLIQPEKPVRFGNFGVTPYPVSHRKVLGRTPSQGPLPENLQTPLRAGDYMMDTLFSLLVELGNSRILVASGIDDEPAIPADVLIVGADIQYDRLADLLAGVQPKWVLPNHWDDMFRPLSKPIRPMHHPRKLITRLDLAAFREMVKLIQPAAEFRLLMPFESMTLPPAK